jgi:hypothetical protein
VTLRPAFSLINSEFNEFLFASVGDEENGMPLSVISALTRLGIDPWEQAAKLSALPLSVAESTLAPMIARLPAGSWLPSDAKSIAARLVMLLPRRRPTAPSERQGHAVKVVNSQTALWAVCIILAAIGVVSIALNGELPWNADRVSAPAYDSAQSPQSKP